MLLAIVVSDGPLYVCPTPPPVWLYFGAGCSLGVVVALWVVLLIARAGAGAHDGPSAGTNPGPEAGA